MIYFTKLPGAYKRALQIGETCLNDFCRCRNKSKQSMDQRRIWNSKYFAKSLRLQASRKGTLSQCAHRLMGEGRKDHYGLLPSTLLFYRVKEMRALCPTAFEEFKTGVHENMNSTPEVILFQYRANLYIMKNFWGDVDCVEDQTLGWKILFQPVQ